ncbi:DUF262 domain-containing protein [Pedobacter frigiditerrae]|uniref:DUF262 domain-containing protein n=1 Tax=Pedobacter frigiditerrae TaxID=2530452 RepID=UPI00293020FF|nr:DUF262 domain-containing protein [Pedobacter frigiditerrae]
METKDKTGKLLYTISEIFNDNGYLSEKNKEYFNIPHYQRGYKWEPNNVNKLLTDIDNFIAGDGKFYCLQNITIVANNNVFNVIDGQQRLTTLTIILSYLGEKLLVNKKVRFPQNSIRKYSNQFLNEIVTRKDLEFPAVTWEDYVEKFPEYDLQDIGHMFNVYRAIEGWFEAKNKENQIFAIDKFLNKLLHDVKIIVNEVDGQTSEEKVFGNLNSKRIPLDGSDLIRAILITRVAREEARKETDLKNIIYVNERRVKLGWELDQINNWWGSENIKGYFSKFVSVKSELIGGDKKLFNEEHYPINYLYLLYAETKGKNKLTLDLIEQHTNSAIALYKEILKLHYTLQDWYSNKEIYHYLGFLFNVRGKNKANFREIWINWQTVASRDEFIEYLKSSMKKCFLGNDEELIDFKDHNTNWYEDKENELVMSLVLMDVIQSIKENQPNLPFNFFHKDKNDIEHIFPKKPKELKNKKAYIDFLNKFEKDQTKHFNLKNYDKLIQSEKYQLQLENHIDRTIAEYKINAIGNLVLLYNSLNRSISNSIYSEKRSRIIEYYSLGHFIQPHTFKVFTRDFNDPNQKNRDFEYWVNDDILRNGVYIDSEINKFFTPKSK